MDTCVCVVEIYRLSLSFPRSLAHVATYSYTFADARGGYVDARVWCVGDMGYVFEKALPPRRPPWPPTGAGGAENPRAESPRPRRSGAQTPQRSTHAHDRSQERRHTCRIVRFRSDLRLPHAALATPQAAFARLVALFHFAPVVARWGPRWPPRLVAAPTTVRTTLGQRTTRPAHESRQPAPPTGAASATPSFCTRHCGATTDALRSPLQPCPGRSRRVRAVRGPYCVLGDGRLGVEPLRPERCTTMSVRRYSVYSASRASRVHAPYVRVSRPPPGGVLVVAGRCG